MLSSSNNPNAVLWALLHPTLSQTHTHTHTEFARFLFYEPMHAHMAGDLGGWGSTQQIKGLDFLQGVASLGFTPNSVA